MANWQTGAVKTQLRTTIQRLGQLQQKIDSQGTITRRDIATLLKQGNIGLARTKTHNLILDDALGDLLERLEMYLGVIMDRIGEIEANAPTPNVVEAAATIIMAAPHVDSRDLQMVRDLLIQRLGPDFARSAITNRDQHVPPNLVAAISSPPPSASKLDRALVQIAKTYNVDWRPEPLRHDILTPLSELLNPDAHPFVDMIQLRRLCSQGIPDQPSWLRPRVWKLLLGIVSETKASWEIELQKQRESYYDLIRRVLEPFSSFPAPTTPLETQDTSLMSVYRQLLRIPPALMANGLDREPEVMSCLDANAPEDAQIPCATNLDHRLGLIQHQDNESPAAGSTPEIRLDWSQNDTPEISLTAPDSPSEEKTRVPKDRTLVPSKAYSAIHAHQKHASALLRMLYVHSCINPGNYSPHLPSLLVVVYNVINQEIEAGDLAHAEADTFWLFEAMVGEFSELEDEEGGKQWMQNFSGRLTWADNELAEVLSAKGLDPALPHYSYRWLAPLLSHTLPLSAVLPIWDALFARGMRERDSSPKLESLIDVCTAMLIRAREPLLRVGKTSQQPRSPGLWDDNRPPPSPIRAWDSSDAFLEGMTLLEIYPVEAAGGVDRLLQTASDLAHRRHIEAQQLRNAPTQSLGQRIRVSMWRGFTNQSASPLSSPLSDTTELKEASPETSPASQKSPAPIDTGISSRLAASVWRGITNQSSMDVPPSPVSPVTPSASRPVSPISPPRSPSPPPPISPEASPSVSLWNYAEKIRDSDAAAKLAKVGTNWKAKAMLTSWGRGGASSAPASPEPPAPSHLRTPSKGGSFSNFLPSFKEANEERRSSLPNSDRDGLYSPPARPAHFRPPRDSILPETLQFSPQSLHPSEELPVHAESEHGLLGKAKNLQETLSALTKSSPAPTTPTPKSGPRPLLLGSTSVMGSKSGHARRGTEDSESGEWADVMRAKKSALNRESMSSVSSLSPSDAYRTRHGVSRSDWDSDGGSRKVPLNRRSISPMAPNFRTLQSRPASSSSISSSDRVLLSPPPLPTELSTNNKTPPSPTSERGWGQIDIPESPPLSSPPPQSLSSSVHDPAVLTDATAVPFQATPPTRKASNKKPTLPQESEADDTSEPSAPIVRSSRTRSKRRPANITVNETSTPVEQKKSPNTLGVEWPEVDLSATPTASSFGSTPSPRSKSPKPSRTLSAEDGEVTISRQRKVSGEGRTRKVSGTSRTRKISSNSKRDSAAVEGDDEGYDDLLSAYESEAPEDLR